VYVRRVVVDHAGLVDQVRDSSALLPHDSSMNHTAISEQIYCEWVRSRGFLPHVVANTVNLLFDYYFFPKAK